MSAANGSRNGPLGEIHDASRTDIQSLPFVGCQGLADYDFLESLNDPDSEDCAKCEMAFVERLEGGCSLPVAAYAEVNGGELCLTGLYADEARGIYRKGRLSGDRKDAVKLGETLAEHLKQEGENFG